MKQQFHGKFFRINQLRKENTGACKPIGTRFIAQIDASHHLLPVSNPMTKPPDRKTTAPIIYLTKKTSPGGPSPISRIRLSTLTKNAMSAIAIIRAILDNTILIMSFFKVSLLWFYQWFVDRIIYP